MSQTDPRPAGRVAAAERKQAEYIDIFTAAGVIVIDLTACIENDYVNLEDGEGTTGEAIMGVKEAIRAGNPLLKLDGYPILIDHNTPPIAMGYRREGPF